MAVHPLRPATRRRLGRPLPHQQADRPRAHPTPKKLSNHHTKNGSYPVLDPVSQAYPEVQGRSPTCYSPVRHSSTSASTGLSVRLACVKHAASVRPEPGSNSPQKGREKPKPRQTDKPHRMMQTHHTDWLSKNYIKKKSNTNPQPDGDIQGGWPSQKILNNTPKQLKMFTMTPLERKAPSGIHQPQHTYNASRPQ